MASACRAPVVYIISSINELAIAARKCLPSIKIVDIKPLKPGELSKEDETEVLGSAEILLADLPFIAKYIYSAQKLKWAHSTWAGVETIMRKVDVSKPPNVILSRAGTSYTDLMAEYVLGYILAREKNIFGMFTDQQNKVWSPLYAYIKRQCFHHYKLVASIADDFAVEPVQPRFAKQQYRSPRLLSDLRLGVLGAGQIGTRIGTLCKAAGMEVWGIVRQHRDTKDLPLNVYKTSEDLPEILQSCDYICNVLPSTPATKDLLSGDILKHCTDKKSVFINVGRGNVIDDESLLKALRNEWISGAVLDVFNTEPLPTDSPLWACPNVLITPHISGPCQTNLVLKSFVDNYHKFTNNQPLTDVVEWERGY